MRDIAESKPLAGNSIAFTFPVREATLTRKNTHVETLRGVAIILVVLGHMIGYTSTGGMRVSDDSFLRYLYYSLEYVRLPLFTVISGWVYANKPIVHKEGRGKFLKGKLRRLLIPMFVISTILFLFRMVIPGTNTTPDLSQLPRNLVLPYDIYWYLFSLFIIFLLISAFDTQPSFKKPGVWLFTLACSFGFLFISENLLDPVRNLFSFKGAAYLLPFFLIGIGIYRYSDTLLSGRISVVALAIFLVSTILQQMAWFGYFPEQERHSLLGMTVGITAALLLFRLKFSNRLLVYIGGHAYGIFLFHVFFTGGTRIVLERLGLTSQALILILGVIAAIGFSIALEILIKKSAFLRFYLLGLGENKPGRRLPDTTQATSRESNRQ